MAVNFFDYYPLSAVLCDGTDIFTVQPGPRSSKKTTSMASQVSQLSESVIIFFSDILGDSDI